MTEILIYGSIGVDPWEPENSITAKSVMEQLSKIDGDVTVRISSGGGDVFEGIDIMTALKNHDGRVTAIVESVAASAASFIAVGGADRVLMRDSSEMMIHRAATFADGNSSDLRKTLENLDRQDMKLAKIYAGRAGGSTDEWLAAMDAETWYTAEEAVAAGLADEVIPVREPVGAPGVSAGMSRRILAKCKYASRSAAPPPTLPRSESGNQNNTTPSDGQNKEEALNIKGLAQELGVEPEKLRNALSGFFNEEVTVTSTVDVTYPEGSTVVPTGRVTITPTGEVPTGLVFAVGEVPEGWTAEVDEATGVLTVSAPSGAEPDTDVTIPVSVTGNDAPVEFEVVVTVKAAAGEAAPTDPAAPAAPAAPADPASNRITLDQETYAELRQAAQYGWKAMEQQKLAKLDAEVDQWIRDGRIPAARRPAAVKAMRENPQIARDLYGSNPKNTVPMVEIGSGRDPLETTSAATDLGERADKLGIFTAKNFH